MPEEIMAEPDNPEVITGFIRNIAQALKAVERPSTETSFEDTLQDIAITLEALNGKDLGKTFLHAALLAFHQHLPNLSRETQDKIAKTFEPQFEIIEKTTLLTMAREMPLNEREKICELFRDFE